MNNEVKCKCKCHGELDEPVPEWKQIIQLKERCKVLEKALDLACGAYGKYYRKIYNFNKMTATIKREFIQQAESDIDNKNDRT